MKYIGVDPDTDKSGFSVWDQGRQEFDHIGKETFFDLTEKILILREFEISVFVEAGWLNKKSNFHRRKGQSKSVGEKIAKAVGANHQIGKLIVEFCNKNSINVTEVRPTSKKLKSDEFKRITGYKKRTNSEMRDSAMLVFGM